MRLAVFAFTRRGCGTAERARAVLTPEECRMFAPEKFGAAGFAPYTSPLAAFTGPQFAWADALLFVGSTGIAARAVAPHLRGKDSDPAVLVTDEAGRFVIPLLSGHIGGANALARRLADGLGGTAAVTTATDVNRRFSPDAWAAERGLFLSDLAAAKAVSAAILEGDVPLICEFPVSGPLPAGLIRGEDGPVGIYIGCRTVSPFETTLRLIPKILRLGLGCRRGTSAQDIEAAVLRVLAEHRLDRRALRLAASVDRKRDEPGLLEFCENWGLPVEFYTPEELRAVPGPFTPSPFVERTVGVDNVCERAAVLGAERLIVKKTALGGVTVALAVERWEAEF